MYSSFADVDTSNVNVDSLLLIILTYQATTICRYDISRGPNNLPTVFSYFDPLTLPALHQSIKRPKSLFLLEGACTVKYKIWGRLWILMNVIVSLSWSGESRTF